ncbi:hypothetical protein PM082_023869 [Marasmius tenuissimus]|nr:hypothetical protein PM082_023869 [Marasmius tenuissimus]
MPLSLTPGFRLLFRWAVGLSIPPFVSIAFYKADILGDRLPKYAYVAFGIFLLPAFSFVRVVTKEIYQRIEAYKMGARFAPRVNGQWPGNLDVLLKLDRDWKYGYPGDGLADLCKTKGPAYNFRILWEDVLFTTCPEHIQHILATGFGNFVKGEEFQQDMGSLLGVGVFNADGEMWKFHRQMTRPFFTRDRISHFDLFDKHTERVISAMKSRFHEGAPLDFQDLMGKFTLDAATEFLFGSCVDNLSSPLPYPSNHASSGPSTTTRADRFSQAFLRAQEAVAQRVNLGGSVWPLFEIFEDKVKGPMEIVSSFIEPIIAEALAKKRLRTDKPKPKDEVGEEETLLDHLVDITDDPVVLKDATLNIMIAGRDTTAFTLTFVMYFLATHPHVTDRLRKEVLATAGTASEKRKISWEMVREMKYLRAVINETLRLYPVVPFNIRQSVKATTLPSPEPGKPPIYVPAGMVISYSVLLMHRRKDLWGPDADTFDPDRFLDSRLKTYLTPRPFIFLPFNAGPRICLGQQFAYNEMSLILIRLLQHFQSFTFKPECAPEEFHTPKEWEGVPGRKGVDKFFPKTNLTMHCGGGLWIEAEEANGSE